MLAVVIQLSSLSSWANTYLTCLRTRIRAKFRWRFRYTACQLVPTSDLDAGWQMEAVCTVNSETLSAFFESIQDHFGSIEGTTHLLSWCVDYSIMQYSASGGRAKKARS